MSNLILLDGRIINPEPSDIKRAAEQILQLASNQARINANVASKRGAPAGKVREAKARRKLWERIADDMRVVVAENTEDTSYVDERTHVPPGEN